MPSAHRIIQRTWPSAVLMIRHFSWTRVWRNWYDHSQSAFWVNFQNWLKQVKGHALPQHWPENSLTCRAAACSCYNTGQVSLVGVLVQPAPVCCEQPETLRIKFDSQPSKPGEVTTALVLTEATLPCHEGRECSICNLIHLKWWCKWASVSIRTMISVRLRDQSCSTFCFLLFAQVQAPKPACWGVRRSDPSCVCGSGARGSRYSLRHAWKQVERLFLIIMLLSEHFLWGKQAATNASFPLWHRLKRPGQMRSDGKWTSSRVWTGCVWHWFHHRAPFRQFLQFSYSFRRH